MENFPSVLLLIHLALNRSNRISLSIYSTLLCSLTFDLISLCCLPTSVMIFCDHSVMSFVWGPVYFCPADLSSEAKSGRGDVMMAIAYNASAISRCTDLLLSWGMTSVRVFTWNICLMIWLERIRFDLMQYLTLERSVLYYWKLLDQIS